MDGNEDTIVVVSEMVDWSLVETETVIIEKETNVEVHNHNNYDNE